MSRKKVCKCGKVLNYDEKCSCLSTSRKEYFKEYNSKNSERDDAIRQTMWFKKKDQIKKRDNYMCQRCFIKYGIINCEELQVHHIKPRIYYPELMYENTNLICLCGTCNRQIGTREQLDFYFKINEKQYTV